MDTTTVPLTETISRCNQLRPEWLRIPAAINFGGVGRSKLYQLIDAGEVRSVCLRDPKKQRGIRLVNVQSLRDYISSFEGNGKGQANETAKKSTRTK
jgi:hypothetical protein